MEVSSVAEQLLFTTVRVETLDVEGSQGTGTSFIFDYNPKEQHYLFIVTNKHVIAGAEKGRLSFTQAEGEERKQPRLGVPYHLFVDNFANVWYGHPHDEVDVAIVALVPILKHIEDAGVNVFFRSVPSSLVATQEALGKLDALEEVVFIGYPSGIWDTTNLLPVTRKGITATPVAMDFQGQKQFLIDASVFPGSSGSPVFLYNAGMYAQKDGGTVVGTRLMFLGIVSSVFYRDDENKIVLPTAKAPVAVSRQMIDLGIVHKSTTIVETIESFLAASGTVVS